MQSVGRTDTVGRTKFSYPFGSACIIPETQCLYRATSSKIHHNSMLELVLSFIPAENFVAIYHCENKFTNGMLLIKNEFLRSRDCTARIFRESNDKMSHSLSPANTENS